MKAKAILSMLALMLLLGMWGCLETDIGNVDDSVDGEGEGEGEGEDPTLGDVSGSECKEGTKHTSKAKRHGESEDGWDGDDGQEEGWGDDDSDDNHSEPYYGGAIKAQVHENWVRILHMDASYQCEAEIIYMLEANGSELILTEVDSSNVETYCTCNFDLSVDILGLTPGQRYHAEVWNENKSEMFGEVEFTVGDCDIYEKECSYDYECWEYFEEMGGEMPMIDCEGDFACVEGYCEWICMEYPEYCESDYDCPEGYFCDFMDYGYPEGDCWVDEAGEEHCDDIMPEMIGVCEPREWEEYCESDADCPEGFMCMIEDWGNTDPDDFKEDCWINENGEETCIPETGMPPYYGYCVPAEEPMTCQTDQECWHYDYPHPECEGDWECVNNMCEWSCGQGQYECDSDQDCPEGQYCEFYEECWDEDGSWGDCFGGSMCVPYEEPPSECMEDTDCPEGYFCALLDCYNETDPEGNATDCYPYGVCMPREEPPAECVSDDECPEGFFCDNWDPNGMGHCVEQWQGECNEDSQCPEDMFCNIMCGNGWCYGECMPYEEPPAECRSNDECWEIMGPPTIECMGAMWVCENAQCVQTCGMACANDADCPADMFCEMGLCQEEEVPGPECEVDSDCPAGEFCAYVNCEPDANGDPSNCAPYAVCIPYEDPEPVYCGDNGWCPEGLQCDWCPPDPNCPECEVCGQPVCVR